MRDTPIAKSDAKDPLSHTFNWVPQFVRDRMSQLINRDECRTPMQWSDDVNAGFCSPGVEPWLPVNEDAVRVNVAEQLRRPDSLLRTYQSLLALRRGHKALQRGRLEVVERDVPPDVLAFRRMHADHAVSVYLNFGDRPIQFADKGTGGKILFSTNEGNRFNDGQIMLRPVSGLVLG